MKINDISLRQIPGLIGSAVLFIGVFTPIVSAPLIGSVNYFYYGKLSGTLILALAIGSLWLTLKKKYRFLLYTSIGSLAILVWTFIYFQYRLSGARAQVQSGVMNRLGDVTLATVQIQWGWAVLIVGACLLLAAALLKDEHDEAPQDGPLPSKDVMNSHSQNDLLAPIRAAFQDFWTNSRGTPFEKPEGSELFADFEINREPRWPILARLVIGSLVLHGLFLLAVLYVPGVRNALNIASLFAGTGYVDEAYSRTKIRDRATVIDLPHEKFQYPEGYFSTGTGETDAAIMEQAQVVEPPPPPVIIKPPRMPKPTPMPTPTPTPIASPTPSGSPGQVAATPNPPKTPEEAEKELDKVASENNLVRPSGDTINTRPLKDWLARANAMKVRGELDLSQPVEIVIEAELSADGKLLNPQVVQKSGDPRLIEVAKDMVAAISDSGALIFLKDPKQPDLNVKQLRLTLGLDQANVTAKVESQLESEQRAKEVASGYNVMLGLAQWKKSGKDEAVIYKNTKVTADGKQVVVNFSLPRPDAEAMLKKQLPAS
jgi:hypothetical protein